MMNKDVQEMLSELKKIRGDLDKMQAYQKTTAEQVTLIAEHTAPAETPAEPAGT